MKMKKWIWMSALLLSVGCASLKSIPVRVYAVDLAAPQAGLATVRILDAGGQTVRTLLDSKALPVGPWHAQWDGRDDSGKTVAPGAYRAQLTLQRYSLEWQGSFGGLGSGPGRFLNPQGLCAYPQGARLTVAVADTGNQRVQLLTDTGAFLQSAGQFGSGDGGLNQPTDVDWDGLILTVCDSQNRRLARFDSRGIYLGEVRRLTGVQVTPASQLALNFQRPTCLQKGGGSDFWVSDAGQGILFHITSTGGILDEWGSPFSLGNDGPFLQVDGHFWIRTGRDQVSVLDGSGNLTGNLAPDPPFRSVAGMAAGPGGCALISDSARDLIYFLDGDGKVFEALAPEKAQAPAAMSLWNDQLFLIDPPQDLVLRYRLVPQAVEAAPTVLRVGSEDAPGP